MEGCGKADEIFGILPTAGEKSRNVEREHPDHPSTG